MKIWHTVAVHQVIRVVAAGAAAATGAAVDQGLLGGQLGAQIVGVLKLFGS